MLKKCDHSETRLTCQDCSGPVCPKCMVQCAVGFRCPTCAGKFQSHAVQTTPWILARTAIAAAVLGGVVGTVQPFGLGFYGLAFTFFVGILAGRGLHWVAKYKLGPKIVITVAAGLIVGYLVGMAPDLFTFMSAASATTDPAVTRTMTTELLTRLITIGLFVSGCLMPFLRRA